MRIFGAGMTNMAPFGSIRHSLSSELPGSPGRTGAASPAVGARGGGAPPTALKRKLTLLALIDELSALKEDDTSLQGRFCSS
jgi:hypothetical protein